MRRESYRYDPAYTESSLVTKGYAVHPDPAVSTWTSVFCAIIAPPANLYLVPSLIRLPSESILDVPFEDLVSQVMSPKLRFFFLHVFNDIRARLYLLTVAEK